MVEVKTEISPVEATLRKLDEKVRLAPAICRDRFGWHARGVSRLLVMPDERTPRRRVERHRTLLDGAFPLRSVAVRRWIDKPADVVYGIVVSDNYACGYWYSPTRSSVPREDGAETVTH